jgi:hypothetical protein
MKPPQFVGATHQGWKLALPFAVVAIAGLIILSQGMIRARLGPEVTTRLLLCATLVGLGAFSFPTIALRCPRCEAKLFWQAVRTQGASAWLPWLLSLRHCPSCAYKPDDSQSAV